MNFLRLLPVFISFLLLTAHFFRAGEIVLASIPVVLFIPLMFRKTWVPRVIQVALLIGAIEWLYTLVSIAQIRMEFGMPWVRMVLILAALALFTAGSGLVFKGKALRQRYSVNTVP